jgi:hypothetical protein
MADLWSPDFPVPPAIAHLAPWRDVLEGPDWPGLDRLNDLARQRDVVNGAGRPITFGAQTVRCGQRDYESVILANGEVPTRLANWHDLYNAFTWLALPRTKAVLNAVQCTALERSPRGPLSDAATLFDESGLILAGPEPEVADLLRARRWREACVDRREAWGHLKVRVIGHAILEKLRAPWPGITAKCLYVQLGKDADEATLDGAVAEVWRRGDIARPADLFPLPVLGVPGWWPANGQAGFYDNREVFRS